MAILLKLLAEIMIVVWKRKVERYRSCYTNKLTGSLPFRLASMRELGTLTKSTSRDDVGPTHHLAICFRGSQGQAEASYRPLWKIKTLGNYNKIDAETKGEMVDTRKLLIWVL